MVEKNFLLQFTFTDTFDKLTYSDADNAPHSIFRDICTYSIYVTGSGKTGLIATITDIHFLPVRESCTHALPRNTQYLIIDGQVCFYRRLLPMLSNQQGAFHGPGGH